ncbi:MAG: NHL repeat-containing protein [Candidatus Krumholzibacteria bacterium]|nr:NHL repeat-containing protein [Candidatus Krumholzibacteria bacterium]
MHRLIIVILTALIMTGGTLTTLPGASPGARGETRAPADTAAAPLLVPTGLVYGAGELREPLGLDVDVRGFIFVADAMAGKVFRYAPDGSSIELEAPPSGAGIYPIDVAASGSYVYVLDYAGNRLLRYDYKGAYLDVLLDFSQFPGMHPSSVTTSGGGRLLVTDARSHTVTVWSPLLDVEIVSGGYGWTPGSFNKPSKATFFDDERIAVAETGNRRVQVLTGAGGYERYLERTGGTGWNTPRYCCDGPGGVLLVADAGSGTVHLFSQRMEHLAAYGAAGGAAEFAPAAVAAGWDDLVYVADLKSRTVIALRLVFPGN